MSKGDAAYLQFDGTDLYFECVTSESAEHASTVTEHVVEEGANVTDHVRSTPRKVSLELFVSNTPVTVGGFADMQTTFTQLDVEQFEKPLIPTPGALLQAGATALSNLINGKPLYKAAVLKASSKVSVVKETVALLERWRKESVLGVVVLPWGKYNSMVITKVTPMRDGATGDAAKVSLELTEVRLVEAKLVTAPVPTEVRGQTMVAKGKQPAEPVREDGPKKSVAKALKDRLLGGS